jgi:hypothetical protein
MIPPLILSQVCKHAPVGQLAPKHRPASFAFQRLSFQLCAKLWILRTFADHLCGILKVEHFFAFEERFRGPKEIQ